MRGLRQYLIGPLAPWQKVALAVLALGLPVAIAAKRGWLIGVVAAAVYGGMAFACILRWDRVQAWSLRHPLVDSAFIVPVLFLALAYITSLSTALCIVISILAGACLVGLGPVTRARRV
jgi:hypothetical protein